MSKKIITTETIGIYVLDITIFIILLFKLFLKNSLFNFLDVCSSYKITSHTIAEQ